MLKYALILSCLLASACSVSVGSQGVQLDLHSAGASGHREVVASYSSSAGGEIAMRSREAIPVPPGCHLLHRSNWGHREHVSVVCNRS
jgi:hypothetical protein